MKIVNKKSRMTIKAENMPKAYNGLIGEMEHMRKATVDVSEVTNMALADFQKVYVSRRTGWFFKAAILVALAHMSWKTKMSSDPMPTMMIRQPKCKVPK